jgi:hypothetical protein
LRSEYPAASVGSARRPTKSIGPAAHNIASAFLVVAFRARRDQAELRFVDFIGSHGSCASQTLSQPQLKLDVGNFWSKPGKAYVGVEWKYWRNKFGIAGLKEDFPQLLGVWVF